MYSTWEFSSRDAKTLSRALEAHLNEFAEEVLSVSYAVQDDHYVLVVYRAISRVAEGRADAVAAAEQILDSSEA